MNYNLLGMQRSEVLFITYYNSYFNYFHYLMVMMMMIHSIFSAPFILKEHLLRKRF